MEIVTLDLEGVLVPEIWIAFSEKTGIPELKRTTRDEPDYHKLMAYRINILREHNLKLSDIQDVIATIKPLEGAKAFLDELRELTQVIILSDTFSEFALPLMRQLGYPTIFCNSLKVSEDGMIEDVKDRGGSGYVVDKIEPQDDSYFCNVKAFYGEDTVFADLIKQAKNSTLIPHMKNRIALEFEHGTGTQKYYLGYLPIERLIDETFKYHMSTDTYGLSVAIAAVAGSGTNVLEEKYVHFILFSEKNSYPIRLKVDDFFLSLIFYFKS